MNKIYRLIWCKATGKLAIASEHAKSKGGSVVVDARKTSLRLTRLSAAILMFSGSGAAWAADAVCVNPANPAIVVGTTSGAGNEVACGEGATAAGTNAIAIGDSATANGSNSTAIGVSAVATGNSSLSVGEGTGFGSIGNQNVAVGVQSGRNISNVVATDNNGVAVLAGQNVAFGVTSGNNVVGNGNTAVGVNAGNNVGPLTDPDPKFCLFPTFYCYGGGGNGSNNTAIGPAAASDVRGAQNIGIGFRAGSQTTGNNNMGIGQLAGYQVTGSGNAAIGSYAGSNVTGIVNTAIGNSAGQNVTGDRNAAMGNGAGKLVTGNTNTAIGQTAGSELTGSNNVAVGVDTGRRMIGSNNISVGRNANQSSNPANPIVVDFATAIGDSSRAWGTNTIAMGTWTVAGVRNNLAIVDAIAIGNHSNATGNKSVAIGSYAVATGIDAVASGNSALASGYNSVAMGANAKSTGEWGAVAVGGGEVGLSTNVAGRASVALGFGSNANPTLGDSRGGTALGSFSSAGDASYNTAVGYRASANGGVLGDGTFATSVGAFSNANGILATALGSGAKAQAMQSITIGGYANNAQAGAIVIGTPATIVGGANAVAVGAGAIAANANDVAFGAGSVTSAAAPTASAIIRGTTYNFAGATPTSVASVGAVGVERQVTNVAAGRLSGTSTDAVNGSQLFATNQAIDALSTTSGNTDLAAVKYQWTDANSDGIVDPGEVNYTQVTMNPGGASTTISNVAAGQVTATSTDAVNGSQLQGTAQSVANHLGGGSVVNADGILSAPTYATSTGSYNNVGSAVLAANQQTNRLGSTMAAGLGGASTYDPATGSVVTALSVGGTTYNDVNSALNALNGSVSADVSALTARVATNETNVSAIQNGAAGMFQVSQAAGAAPAVTGLNAAAGGSDAVANGDNSTAIGNQSLARGTNSTALGQGAQAIANSSIAIGSGSMAIEENVVSIGNVGAERRIVNVAAGVNGTDAVNVQQLQGYFAGGVQYDKTGGGAVNPNSVTFNPGGTGPTTLHNVAAGVALTDAVNVGQLNAGLGNNLSQANAYTDSRVNSINNDIWTMRRDYRGATASAMAMAGLPQAYLPGKSMLAAGMGGYHGQYGIAVGLSGISESGKWVYKAQASGNTASDWGFSAGVGIQW